MKSDTMDLIPIPEEGASLPEELQSMIEVMERAKHRLEVLQEGKEARSSAEGERALQELDLVAASVRTIQTKVRIALTEREEKLDQLLGSF